MPSPLRPLANPPNPWATTDVEYLDGEAPLAELEVFEDQSRGILSHNDSPDVGFDWSVNPYRGCFHSCAYCYARPSHEYLSFGAGTDFDRKIVVKKRAPELLREAFEAAHWGGSRSSSAESRTATSPSRRATGSRGAASRSAPSTETRLASSPRLRSSSGTSMCCRSCPGAPASRS